MYDKLQFVVRKMQIRSIIESSQALNFRDIDKLKFVGQPAQLLDVLTIVIFVPFSSITHTPVLFQQTLTGDLDENS